ncbi:protein of unknown function [Cnuella takakiae]|uniref:3-keto-alpha-glucoside-1,2-lyase/3-keto-2-hydroxy-glucal hydratase domain-containing protein n=1 Tax=Cnuella takakiae TaxID=1302690 RepID=A0A1M5CHL6_9BACT|nr:DUF1080 domain-containing protein [Cnuella takakiae]OLY91829.1 hypothetical protein BUE76_07890 [Cnuella takakiae]SHF54265.1 protein of unknown function [Cnuella takakiae]
MTAQKPFTDPLRSLGKESSGRAFPAFPLHALIVAFFCFVLAPSYAQLPGVGQWKPLFNGRDLKDWETYLVPSVAAADQTPIGLNKDPHGVFTVVDGGLRISGQDWGGIMTKESFSNYHLRFQVKWGAKKWAPREQVVPDGGLLFHCSLPYDYGSKCWMRSLELQIQQTDIGDYHNVGAGIPEIQVSPSKDDGDVVDQYDPNGPFKHTDKRVYRSANFESPEGQWTTGELVARGADAVFIVNGFVVNRLYNIYREDLHQQTTGGRIQFQSEGAEHFLKNIESRPINFHQNGVPVLSSAAGELVFKKGERKEIVITNKGDAVEIIAAELLGKDAGRWSLKLPVFPINIEKGKSITIQVELKEAGMGAGDNKLKLETLLGPVKDFEIRLKG